MKVYLFPGQGTQWTRMGRSIYENHPSLRSIFEEANEILGFSLTRLMFNDGHDAELRETKYCQPAILVNSYAAYRMHALQAMANETLPKRLAVGHSLGEFSALLCSNVLGFRDALLLVQARGLAMSSTVGSRSPFAHSLETGMFVLFLSANRTETDIQDQISSFVSTAQDAVIEISNYNAKSQIVIAGHVQPMERFIASLRQQKYILAAKRLNVSAPFHCSLMQQAKETFSGYLSRTAITVNACPDFPFLSTVYQAPVSFATEKELKSYLETQLISPVYWRQCMRYCMALEPQPSELIEFGSDVLSTTLLKDYPGANVKHVKESCGRGA